MRSVGYNSSKKGEILEFARTNPWKPTWRPNQIEFFLENLISGDSLVIDLFNSEGRVATVLLLNKISNPQNSVSVEIIGCLEKISPIDLWTNLVPMLKERTPEDKTGFDVTIHDSLNIPESFFSQRHLKMHYEIFEMRLKIPTLWRTIDSTNIFPFSEDQAAEVYQVLCETFKENLETSIPSYSDWHNGFKGQQVFNFWVFKESNKILGFVRLSTLSASSAIEISTIGVLSDFRRKGIGRRLLEFSIYQAAQLGATTCTLSVAAENDRALSLYRKIGFTPKEHYRVYAFRRP